jgi:UDP-GlcNAc:undecaprenyl-phosphate GlcNAc-1-phosphate transferase
MLTSYAVLLTAFFLGIIFIALFKSLSLRYKILSTQGMPLVGGIGLGLSFIIACLVGFFLSGELSKGLIGILISSLIMLIFGIIDDQKELSVKAKFLVQSIAICLLILFGVKTQIVGIGGWLNLIITFIWVFAITNAINHLDVMDGLAGVAALVISFAFVEISIFNNDTKITILSLSLAGAISGFLIYNTPPAKIYMGNSGSHFIGFILAAIALAISYAPLERKVALFSPLVILSFPIFDTGFLILKRIMQKKSAFKKSGDHLALILLKAGWTKDKILVFMFFLCFFFCASGIVLSQVSNSLGAAIIAFVILTSLILTIKTVNLP